MATPSPLHRTKIAQRQPRKSKAEENLSAHQKSPDRPMYPKEWKPRLRLGDANARRDDACCMITPLLKSLHRIFLHIRERAAIKLPETRAPLRGDPRRLAREKKVCQRDAHSNTLLIAKQLTAVLSPQQCVARRSG